VDMPHSGVIRLVPLVAEPKQGVERRALAAHERPELGLDANLQRVSSQSPASHQPVTSQSPASHQPGYNQSATNHRPTISQSPQLSSVCQRIMIIWGSQCCVSAESVMRCFDYHCCTPIAKLALSLAAPGTFGIQQHAQAVNPHPIVDLL
jgi:hypothetical protein